MYIFLFTLIWVIWTEIMDQKIKGKFLRKHAKIVHTIAAQSIL